MKKIIVWILDAILWFITPKLYRVGTDIDEDFAKFLVSNGGAKPIVIKK